MKHPVYLVPVDFSTVSISAMKTAIGLAQYNNGSVMAIHVVSKKSEREDARNKFKEIFSSYTSEESDRIEGKVLIGNVYDDIAKAAEIVNASLIVMGTHGAKGLQKLFGSHALKLVSSTSTPFVILQEGSSLTGIKNIVMPFNFEKESIQIANFAGYIARQFHATIHLVGYHDKDEWLNGKSQRNQMVVRKLFDEHNISYQIVNLEKSKLYMQALMEYGESIHADLIASSFFVDTMLPTMNNFIQALIENDRQIPLLTVNSEELTISSNLSFMTV